MNWEKKIQIDKNWVERHLNHHFDSKELKIIVRGYTPKVSGTIFSCSSMINELAMMIPEYAFSEDQKEEVKKNLVKLYGDRTAEKYYERNLVQMSQKFFGKKNPQTDGKYGELLLFALVESVLNSKMVAHKIVNLTNFKDQVKGGDGIFLGDYDVNGKSQSALFIGESKVQQDFSKAVDEALISLNRFHDPLFKSEFNNTEFIVAKDTLMIDDNYEELYDRLTPGTNEYNKQIIVHPILIMFNTASINSFETKSTSTEELEGFIKSYMSKNMEVYKTKINEKLNNYEEIKKVFIDIFIFPFNNIDNFRNGMYYNIHGVAFQSGANE